MNSEIKKIAVVGPGAMGCLFAGLLDSPGRDLWLLDKNPGRAKSIASRGVIIESKSGRRIRKLKVTADPAEPGMVDLVIICVKAYDTKSAAQSAAPLVGLETQVLSLQNGVGNLEILVELFGTGRSLGGTTAQGANLVAPGHLRHAGAGETVIGQPDGGVSRAEAVAELFAKSGIEARATQDVQGLIWTKLVINAAINPLTAILGVKNGSLLYSRAARAIMADAVAEVAAVCAKKNIQLLCADPGEKACSVAKATAENISSMCADVRARRRTEVNQINGAVARAAEECGLEAPVNRTLAGIVTAIEETYELKI